MKQIRRDSWADDAGEKRPRTHLVQGWRAEYGFGEYGFKHRTQSVNGEIVL